MRNFQYKFLILLCLISFSSFAQVDTTTYKRSFLGITANATFTNHDFSGLRKYTYLQNKPSDFMFGETIGILVGNSEKLFATFLLDNAAHSSEGAIYNNYRLHLSDNFTSLGGLLTVPIKLRYNKKVFKGIYISAGARKTSVQVKTMGTNQFHSGQDTTFENSKAKTIVLNGEILIEFFDLRIKRKKYPNGPQQPLAIKIGYNLQLTKPTWSGTYSRIPGDENPKMNLGGIYASIGMNFWWMKGLFKYMATHK